MRLAAIDIGSNSIRAIVADVSLLIGVACAVTAIILFPKAEPEAVVSFGIGTAVCILRVEGEEVAPQVWPQRKKREPAVVEVRPVELKLGGTRASSTYVLIGVCVIALIVAGILMFTAEAQHGTLAVTLAARPARWVTVVAKTAMAVAVGATYGAAAMAAGFAGALAGGAEFLQRSCAWKHVAFDHLVFQRFFPFVLVFLLAENCHRSICCDCIEYRSGEI